MVKPRCQDRLLITIPSIKVRADTVWGALKIGRSSASSDRTVLYRLLGLVLIGVSRDGDNYLLFKEKIEYQFLEIGDV